MSKQWLGEGLLNSEGVRHQHQRRLLQPALHRQRLAQYATVMTTSAARLRQAWQDGDTLDIAPAMMRITLAIAAKTLLDADVEAEATAIGQAITTLLQGSARVPLPLAPLVRRLPLPSQRRLRRAEAYLDTLIYRLIDARRTTGRSQSPALDDRKVPADDVHLGDRRTAFQQRPGEGLLVRQRDPRWWPTPLRRSVISTSSPPAAA